MNKTVQINYCRKVLCVTAYPCVLTSVPLTYVGAFGFVGFILFFSGLSDFRNVYVCSCPLASRPGIGTSIMGQQAYCGCYLAGSCMIMIS